MAVKPMSFGAFDTKKIDEYAAQAKASWGKTDACKEFEQKSRGRSKETGHSGNDRGKAEKYQNMKEMRKIRDVYKYCFKSQKNHNRVEPGSSGYGTQDHRV